MEVSIQLNHEYSKDEIETIFHTDFGARIKGINLRRWDNDNPYIILFSRADGPYADSISNGIFYYDGEGTVGDQKFTAANKSLANSNTDLRPIYGFRRETTGEKWKYIGLLEVITYDYIQKGGRRVYEYKIRQTQIETTGAIIREEKEIELESLLPVPSLTEDRKSIVSTTKKKHREEAFRKKIKQQYENTCVVCKCQRFTNANYPEVQAAHIYPVEKNGSDDLRNGVALCRLHHWAFDGGLFSIDDNLLVVVSEKILNDPNYLEISKYNFTPILLPRERRFAPSKIFLKQHRILSGFEAVD